MSPVGRVRAGAYVRGVLESGRVLSELSASRTSQSFAGGVWIRLVTWPVLRLASGPVVPPTSGWVRPELVMDRGQIEPAQSSQARLAPVVLEIVPRDEEATCWPVILQKLLQFRAHISGRIIRPESPVMCGLLRRCGETICSVSRRGHAPQPTRSDVPLCATGMAPPTKASVERFRAPDPLRYAGYVAQFRLSVVAIMSGSRLPRLDRVTRSARAVSRAGRRRPVGDDGS